MTSKMIRPLAATAMVILFVAGCSSAPSTAGTPSSGANNTATNLDQAVRFAQCMRDNGVSQFPDPDASGQLTIDGVANGSSLNTNTPAFQQALSACKSLEPPGFTGNPRTAQQQEAALKFAQCMRAKGVTDFPDPAAGAPLIDTTKIPSLAGKDPRSDPSFTAAMQECNSFAAAAGVTGGK